MADIYLQLPGIPGTSLDRDHKDWIEVTSATWGVENQGGTGAGGGAGAGKSKQHPLVVTAQTSIATPLIFEKIANGTHLATAKLEVVRPTGGRPHVAIRWEFEDARLTLLDVSGAEPGFSDAFQLSARRTRLTVFAQDPKGGAGQPVTRGWDFSANQPW